MSNNTICKKCKKEINKKDFKESISRIREDYKISGTRETYFDVFVRAVENKCFCRCNVN